MNSKYLQNCGTSSYEPSTVIMCFHPDAIASVMTSQVSDNKLEA